MSCTEKNRFSFFLFRCTSYSINMHKYVNTCYDASLNFSSNAITSGFVCRMLHTDKANKKWSEITMATLFYYYNSGNRLHLPIWTWWFSKKQQAKPPTPKQTQANIKLHMNNTSKLTPSSLVTVLCHQETSASWMTSSRTSHYLSLEQCVTHYRP